MYPALFPLILLLTASTSISALPNPQQSVPQNPAIDTTNSTVFNSWPPLPINSRLTSQPAAQIGWMSLTSPPLTATRRIAEFLAMMIEESNTYARLNETGGTGPVSTAFSFEFNSAAVAAQTGVAEGGVGGGDGVGGFRLSCPAGGMWPSKQFYLDVMTELADKVRRWGLVGVTFGVLGNKYETLVSGCSIGAAA